MSVAIVVNDGQHSKQESPLVCDKNSVLYGFGQGERLTSVNLNELGTRQGYAMNLDENYDRYASPSANIYGGAGRGPCQDYNWQELLLCVS